MNGLEDVLVGDSIIATLVVAIVTALWAWVQRNKLYREKVERDWGAAVSAIEAAVQETYEDYVRGLKQARMDGRLTDDERSKARRMAVDSAMNILGREGRDIAQILGDRVDVEIEKAIQRLKGPKRTGVNLMPLLESTEGDTDA